MRTKLAVLLMVKLLVLYLVFAIRYGVLLIGVGEPVAVGLGVALFVLPLIAIWALITGLVGTVIKVGISRQIAKMQAQPKAASQSEV